MVQINFALKEVNCKIVFYGPGMSGKTTNLEIVHQKAPEQNKGELTSISTDGDRTLFFDFMPLDLGNVAGMRTKFQLYTVPGQVYYNSTRKLVLQGVDGVIFVADSDPEKMPENIESYDNLIENLAEYGKDVRELPHVLQYNKRDLPGAMSVEDMDAQLNKFGVPTFEAVANTGEGVFPTLKVLAGMVLESIDRMDSRGRGGAQRPAAAAAAPAAAAPEAATAAAPAAAPAAPAAAAAPQQRPVTGRPAAPAGEGRTPGARRTNRAAAGSARGAAARRGGRGRAAPPKKQGVGVAVALAVVLIAARWRGLRVLLHAEPGGIMSSNDQKKVSANEKLRRDRLTFYTEDIQKIDKLLAEFLRLSGAKCALLIDKEGHLVTKRGEVRTIDMDTISALVAGSFAATKEMARLLGEEEFTAMYHQGERDNIQLGLVGDRTLLTILFDDRTTVGMVRLYANETAKKLAEIFKAAMDRGPEDDPGLNEGFHDDAKDKLKSLFD